jgi:hypothetical protein
MDHRPVAARDGQFVRPFVRARAAAAYGRDRLRACPPADSSSSFRLSSAPACSTTSACRPSVRSRLGNVPGSCAFLVRLSDCRAWCAAAPRTTTATPLRRMHRRERRQRDVPTATVDGCLADAGVVRTLDRLQTPPRFPDAPCRTWRLRLSPRDAGRCGDGTALRIGAVSCVQARRRNLRRRSDHAGDRAYRLSSGGWRLC